MSAAECQASNPVAQVGIEGEQQVQHVFGVPASVPDDVGVTCQVSLRSSESNSWASWISGRSRGWRAPMLNSRFWGELPQKRSWKSRSVTVNPREMRAMLGVSTRSALELVEEAPVRNLWRTKALQLLEHRFFQTSIAAIIGLNSIYLGVETDYVSEIPKAVSYEIEAAFLFIFVLEMLLRLYALQWRFFVSSPWEVGWNFFDLGLVLLALVDLCIITAFFEEASEDLEGFAILRVLRGLRITRVLRLMQYFKELWLMVTGVFDAMRSLFWAWLLIFIIMYIFAVLITGSMGKAPGSRDSCEGSPEQSVGNLFGSVEDGMFTLFSVMTINGWGEIARCAMQRQSWAWAIFVLFLLCTSYGMLNVIIAVIVEGTLERAMTQQREQKQKHDLKRREVIAQVFELFVASDLDGNGHLTHQEFLSSLQQRSVMRKLLFLGIDPRKARNLFDILDYDNSGALDMQEFVSGMLRVRGEARCKDIIALQCDVARAERRYREELLEIKERFMQRMDAVDSEVEALHSEVRSLIRALELNGGQQLPGKQSDKLLEGCD